MRTEHKNIGVGDMFEEVIRKKADSMNATLGVWESLCASKIWVQTPRTHVKS